MFGLWLGYLEEYQKPPVTDNTLFHINPSDLSGLLKEQIELTLPKPGFSLSQTTHFIFPEASNLSISTFQFFFPPYLYLEPKRILFAYQQLSKELGFLIHLSTHLSIYLFNIVTALPSVF